MSTVQDRRRGPRIAAAAIAVAVGAAIGVYVSTRPAPTPAGQDRAAIEAVVRAYILDHPEIIPEAMGRLDARRATDAIAASRARLETPFAGAWTGNPEGDVTVVEFFDYACGFCRAALPDIDRLLADDKGVKLVFRELPILGEASDKAARVSLAAAKQGRFLPFHRALYAAGPLDETKIGGVSTAAGLSGPRLASDLAGSDIAAEIDGNLALARALKMNGTPTFVVGDRIFSGAVGYAALRAAVAEARARRG